MSNPKSRFFRVYNKLLDRYSNLVFRSVLRTPPTPADTVSDTVLYTVLGDRHRRAYLLAVKSFLRFGAGVRVVVQSDGSLGLDGERELKAHVPGLEVIGLEEAYRTVRGAMSPRLRELLPILDDPRRCVFFIPLKLLSVIYRFRGRKVILFDSDLLFLREPSFVNNWVRDGRSHCFHSDGGNALTQTFHRLGFDRSKVDVACFSAGFVGMPVEVSDWQLDRIFSRIAESDPALFANWEIEQAIWAVLFNSLPNPVNLDTLATDYVGSSYWSLERIERSSILVHFVGSMRFKDLNYLKLARRVINELSGCCPAMPQRLSEHCARPSHGRK